MGHGNIETAERRVRSDDGTARWHGPDPDPALHRHGPLQGRQPARCGVDDAGWRDCVAAVVAVHALGQGVNSHPASRIRPYVQHGRVEHDAERTGGERLRIDDKSRPKVERYRAASHGANVRGPAAGRVDDDVRGESLTGVGHDRDYLASGAFDSGDAHLFDHTGAALGRYSEQGFS